MGRPKLTGLRAQPMMDPVARHATYDQTQLCSAIGPAVDMPLVTNWFL